MSVSKYTSPESYTPKHLAEKILISRSAIEGERKQVTVLFCDIASSTPLAERLGADAMHDLLRRFFDLALAEVHRYEGTVNQFLGDGFMALFGAPVAHEDHARRAVLAAWSLGRRVQTQSEGVAVRMGLNTGLVVVGSIGDNLRMDYTAIGDTTNLAARLQQLAEPGGILLSETTWRLVEAFVECEELGARRVKGKTNPVPMYRLLTARTRPRPARPENHPLASPLVGRDREVAALSGCLERLVRGQGGIVAVLGEAGLGKSRLMAEVSRRTAEFSLLWLEGRALSFGRTLSYWPFLEILRQWAGITEEDSEAEAQAKVEGEVAALLPEEVSDVLPYITTLLGLPVPESVEHRVKYLDGQAMRQQIFRSMRRLFERLANARPVVLVFEDLHWADASSAELIEHLLPLTDRVPLLLCGISRPDQDSPAALLPDIARTGHGDRYTEISVGPLTPATTEVLLANLLGSSRTPGRLRALVLARTEGNPLFVEEVLRSLVNARTLEWDSLTGEWRMAREIDEVAIPETLQGVIAARIDRLDESVKQALKVASVVGRSFIYRVLAAISDVSDRLDISLEELQKLELIREKRRLPELEYFFKHALVQEAAYESILAERRRELHRHVGQCIERLFADRLDDFYGILAHHYARAEEWTKAQEYLSRAGDHAGRVAADAEALGHYRQAMKVYELALGDRWDPTERGTLEYRIGEALYRRGQHDEATDHLYRALAALGHPYPVSNRGVRIGIVGQIVRQLGHRWFSKLMLRGQGSLNSQIALRSSAYEILGVIHYFSDQERMVLDALMQLNASERDRYPAGIVKGCTHIAIVCDLIPLFPAAAAYHRQAVGLAEETQHPVALGWAYFGLGFHEQYTGRWKSAFECYRRSAEESIRAGDMERWGLATVITAYLQGFTGELRQSRVLGDALLRIGEESGSRQLSAAGLHAIGRALWLSGVPDEAIPYLERATASYRDNLDHIGAVHADSNLACCYLAHGDANAALAILERARAEIVARRMRGHQLTEPLNGLAHAYLMAAERHTGAERRRTLERAWAACRAALRHGRSAPEGMAASYRLMAKYQWLLGHRSAARKLWLRSLTIADQLGARLDYGLALFELGTVFGLSEHRRRAEAVFADIGTARPCGR